MKDLQVTTTTSIAAAVTSELANVHNVVRALSRPVESVLTHEQVIREIEGIIERGEQLLARRDQAAALLRRAIEPIIREQLAQQIAVLIGCFPANLSEFYGACLFEDVLEERPGIGTVEMAFRKLRRDPEQKFAPNIGQVLEAIENEKHTVDLALCNLADLPKLIQRKREVLAMWRQGLENQRRAAEKSERQRCKTPEHLDFINNSRHGSEP
jgi:hypothetical protein